MQEVVLKMDTHSADLVAYALADRLKQVKSELYAMKECVHAGGGSLVERELLPDTVKKMNLKDLAEQINPWITLEQYYHDLLHRTLRLIDDARGTVRMEPMKGKVPDGNE